MNLPPSGDGIPLLAYYATLRLRLFLREILQLHQRFLVAFLYIFFLVLSGNEQLALRQNLAHLLSLESFTPSDLVCLGSFLLYSWIVAEVVRYSVRGGRVHYLVESLPLPFAWERIIRGLALTLVNLIIFVLSALALHQLIQDGGSWPAALLLWTTYYMGIVGSQLSLLEHNWRLFPVWILGSFLLVFSKGSGFVWPCMALNLGFTIWSFRQRETKMHDHPELPIGTWEALWRSAITRRFPARMTMQIAYALAKPALLIYCFLIAAALNSILWMVLKQDIPVSQKIYVYTVITGVLSILISSFFRNFHLQRREWQTWLNSLPKPETWWLRQDTTFVILLYLVLTAPTSLALILHQYMPAPLPFFVLPVHALGFHILRSMQRSHHMENSILFVLGMSVWFILFAYFCDHALQRTFG